ncbi:MAG: hypothetical protein PCFJNLEI_03326 [Verrucomicrobiae bacterium]|nr:hypothetical protein [Verrucomicrobiae bacterium]
MSATIFKIPRQPDRQVIESLQNLAGQAGVPQPELYIAPFEDGGSRYVAFGALENDAILKEVLPLNDASLTSISLVGHGPQQRRHYVTIKRIGKELFDEVHVQFPGNEPRLNEAQFSKLQGLAKKILKEVRIEGVLGGFASEEMTKYYEAREATLSRLEGMNRELLYGIHERQRQLDEQFEKKRQDLDSELAKQREEQQKLFDEKMDLVRQEKDALTKREAELDLRASKALRRQHHKDMLKQLGALNEKFQLTENTRKLRRPIIMFLMVFLAFCGAMTVLNFLQASKIIEAAGNDLTKLSWGHLSLLGLKQLGFGAAFLFGAWYFVKWNDRWLRQHADAEFMFKQMEIDVNRASWVVEMASEWLDEKKAELPQHVVDVLTRNLFKYSARSEDHEETPTDIPSLIFGAASSVKLTTPTGAEIQLDRKGVKKTLKEGGN